MGTVFTFDRQTAELPRYIINFPTKVHWKGKSRLAYVETGLAALIAEVHRLSLGSLALPALGCGLGDLRFDDVCPRIELAFLPHPKVRVLLYAPGTFEAPGHGSSTLI